MNAVMVSYVHDREYTTEKWDTYTDAGCKAGDGSWIYALPVESAVISCGKTGRRVTIGTFIFHDSRLSAKSRVCDVKVNGQAINSAPEYGSQSICSVGHFYSAGACRACPGGRFKALVGNDVCLECPVGRWSNMSGSSSEDSCIACEPGSTTEATGADSEALCVRPDRSLERSCTSGRVCSLHLTGQGLRDGHHLAVVPSRYSCNADELVPNIANFGISDAASDSSYRWGDAMDFVPAGGIYGLCWCHSSCLSLGDFQFLAGELQVVGPFADHSFTCVRGQDCTGLVGFQGHGLSTHDLVSVRTTCGAGSMQISLANTNGLGSLSGAVSFLLSFGSSGTSEDFRLSVNADERGYQLCWCGGTFARDSCKHADRVDGVA